ncbi:MAG: hypothetical protein WAM11_11870 [Cyanobium sp.]
MNDAGARSSDGDAALGWWLVLGLGLGLLVYWGRSRSWTRFRGRKPYGGDRADGLLPPQALRPRTPHARLHDAAYLERMLEAERLSAGQGDDSLPSP